MARDKFYVVDKGLGIAVKRSRKGSDGYVDLFTGNHPEVLACGMTQEEADEFIETYSSFPCCNGLRKFKGSDFILPLSFEEFASSLFEGVKPL